MNYCHETRLPTYFLNRCNSIQVIVQVFLFLTNFPAMLNADYSHIACYKIGALQDAEHLHGGDFMI